MASRPHIVVLLIGLFLATLGGCATPLRPNDALASGTFHIDMRGRFIVQLAVNGGAPRPFIVDTAASISAVYAPFAQEADLVSANSFVTVHGLMASGELPLVQVPQLAFDQASWANRALVLLPRQRLDASLADPPVGILGNDILKSYGIEFSIASRTVRFYSAQSMAQRHYPGWTSVPLSLGEDDTPAGSIYFLDVHIERHPVRAVFDLGSGVNIVNWQAARRGSVKPSDFTRSRHASVGGILEETGIVPRFIAGQINTGSVVWRDEIFGVEDLAIFATLGLDQQPAALLGAGLFAQRDFVIDLQGARVLIRRADEVPAAGLDKRVGH